MVLPFNPAFLPEDVAVSGPPDVFAEQASIVRRRMCFQLWHCSSEVSSSLGAEFEVCWQGGTYIRNSALETKTSTLDQLGQQRLKAGLVSLFYGGLSVGFVGVQNAAIVVEWVQLGCFWVL